MTSANFAIAANRFGYGARRTHLKDASDDPQSWLMQQLTLLRFNQNLPDSNQLIALHSKFRQKKKSNKNMMGPARQYFPQLVADNLSRSISSDQSFGWRLLDFFSNHFSVSAQGGLMNALAPTLEREAIAPHLLGSFTDMLLAVEQHPAMLVYLDNEQSTGPDSRLAKRKSNRGLNENLAREILELHTLGVNGGYDLEDIQELAKAITGWSVARPGKDKGEGFLFRKFMHQPGKRVVLNKQYSDSGVDQGKAILKDLAVHPSTARHVSYKLARHIVSDTPPQALVDAMTKRWLETGGQLREVISTLVYHPASWNPELQKFKSPRDFFISACRATEVTQLSGKRMLFSLRTMGQTPFGAGSPAGFDDERSTWDGADALLTRIDWTNLLVQRLPGLPDPIELSQQIMAGQLSDRSHKIISRAESRKQGLNLLLLSPEFMRR